jgi:hypothetical protein
VNDALFDAPDMVRFLAELDRNFGRLRRLQRYNLAKAALGFHWLHRLNAV